MLKLIGKFPSHIRGGDNEGLDWNILTSSHENEKVIYLVNCVSNSVDSK